MKKIKNLIIKLIGINNYRVILVFLSRALNNVHVKKWFGVNDYNKILKKKNRNVFLGYYDYSAEKNNKVLFLATQNDLKKKAEIYYYDMENQEEKYITSTNTWNYQMGCRLKWFSDKEIIFNDYDNKKGYISRIVDICGKERVRFDFPIYDISNNKKYSFYTNFSILNYFRPGYGYTNEKIEKFSEEMNKQNGIFKGNLETNKSNVILSIEEIKKHSSRNYLNSKYNYINHISVSPYDNLFMFFHLWISENGELRNRVFFVDYDGKVLNIIDDFDRASHYTFKSINEILLTVVINGKVEYRLYNIYTGNYQLFKFLATDGHPSYIDKEKFITDTYPDYNGMQHIYLCDSNGIKSELVQIYHNPKKNGEYRCDLHPRYSNRILTFDSIVSRYRQENIVKVNLLEDNLQVFPNYTYSQKTYMNMFNKIDINTLKLIFCRIFNFKFKAHILVNKMLNSKSKLKKMRYFNKLQSKYSMWISPECKIGDNIHFMHLDGICIGSGVEIGNNCTIYQQVTIGKEKEQFPTIGDNVTIYAGAKILGGIKIGNNAVIGANAVVLKDVPDNCVAVGIPARIIKKD